MKICKPHWDLLRAAIDERGLSHLVSQGGETAFKKVVAELEQTVEEKQSFDPLMAANFAIWSNGLTMGGLYLMTGDLCPICESEDHGGPPAEWWITNAADDQLTKAKELGLVAPPS